MSDFPQNPGQNPPPGPPPGNWSQGGPQQPQGAPQWGQPAADPQWGQGGGGYQPQQQAAPSNGMGLTAMILGIIGLLLSFIPVIGIVLGGLLGLVAVILGVLGRSKAGRNEATNPGQALTGIITGGLAILIAIAQIVIGALFTNAVLESDILNEFGDLTNCLIAAGEDQTAIEDCERAFEASLPGQ